MRLRTPVDSLSEREPVPESLLATVQTVPGVRSAWGSVWGYAQIVDSKGDAISPNGLPTLGNAWAPARATCANPVRVP